MRGMTVLQITMIVSVIIAGIFVILMGSVGETPIYYHTLPEIQFSELLSSFIHTETNLKRTIKEDSDQFFIGVQEEPIEWNETWSSYNDFLDSFGEKLGDAASNYFGSVYVLEGAKVSAANASASGSGSVVSYDSTSNKLTWNYTYKIYLSSKMFGEDVKNEINTTRSLSTEFDFLDLGKVYNCAKNFFANMNETSYKFQKQDSDELECGLTQWLMKKAIPGDCNNFDKSLKISISCGGFECDCRDMKDKPITVTLILSQKGKGTIAFSEEFSNFDCGGLENSCSKGADCVGEDCIGVSTTLGFCGSCLNPELACGSQCSPKTDPTKSMSSGEYRCYRIKSNKKIYKCLKNYGNIQITLDGEPRSEEINLNCGKKHKTLKVEGVTNYFFEFNGVKINSGDLDLCNTTKVPRTNGILTIYSSSEGYDYEVGGININFALSNYINKLNNKEFFYKFNEENCDEFQNNVLDKIKEYIKETGIEGYNWDITLSDVKCTGSNPTTWYNEQYSAFKINFKEKSTGKVAATTQYIIKYRPS